MSYLATRNLWLPMGILWGVNVAFTEIFGAIPGSSHKLFDARLSGNALLTGGSAGAQAGATTLVVVAIVVVLLLWWPANAKHTQRAPISQPS